MLRTQAWLKAGMSEMCNSQKARVEARRSTQEEVGVTYVVGPMAKDEEDGWMTSAEPLPGNEFFNGEDYTFTII